MNGDLEGTIRQLFKGAILDAFREALPEIKEVLNLSSRHESADSAHLFRPRETAEALGISERHLHKLTQEGTIPCIRLGRIVRYSAESLRRWVADNESKGPSPWATRAPATYRDSRSETALTDPLGASVQSRTGTNKPGKNLRKPTVATKRKKAGARPSTKRTPSSVPQASHERTTKTNHNRQSSHKEPSDFDKIAERIGISPDGSPSVTYADIMRIAGIDANTLHGFLCFDRDLSELAVTRLGEFFLEHSTASQASDAFGNRLKERPGSPPEASNALSGIRNVRLYFAERLKVPVETLPQLTNGEVMRIADVDIPTLHGWVYHRRELPAAAIKKLEQYFAAQSRLSQTSV